MKFIRACISAIFLLTIVAVCRAAEPRHAYDYAQLYRQIQNAGSVEIEQRLAEHAPINDVFDMQLSKEATVLSGMSTPLDLSQLDTLNQMRKAGGWEDGWNALMWSAFTGNTTLIPRIIRAGANLNDRDPYGRTALMIAAWQGHADTAHELIKAGASLQCRDWNGESVLEAAAEGGSYPLVSELVDRHVDLNEADSFGQTPLMVASSWGNYNIIEILVQHGANTHQKDNAGQDAADCLTEHYHSCMLILKSQAK